MCAIREGSLREEAVGKQFPDGCGGHVPCCQPLSRTRVLRLGRMTLHVVHYPEVSHMVETVSRAFSDRVSKDSRDSVLLM